MVPVKQVCPSQGSDDPIYTTNNPGYKYFSKPTDQTHPTHLKVATKEEVRGWMGVGGASLGGYCAGVWPLPSLHQRADHREFAKKHSRSPVVLQVSMRPLQESVIACLRFTAPGGLAISPSLCSCPTPPHTRRVQGERQKPFTVHLLEFWKD